jgi:hypothetical protein
MKKKTEKKCDKKLTEKKPPKKPSKTIQKISHEKMELMDFVKVFWKIPPKKIVNYPQKHCQKNSKKTTNCKKSQKKHTSQKKNMKL